MNLLDWNPSVGFIPGHIVEIFKRSPEAQMRTFTVQTKRGKLQSKVYRDHDAYSRDYDVGTKRCWITHHEPDVYPDDFEPKLSWEEYPDPYEGDEDDWQGYEQNEDLDDE